MKIKMQHQFKPNKPSDQLDPEFEPQKWQMRWFFARLYAFALISSIPASVIIVVITKNPIPALVPTPLLFSMKPIIRFLFS